MTTANSDEDRCLSRPRLVRADCVADILTSELAYAPGTGFAYGAERMQIAAAMAEKAAGRLWEDLFQENMADPMDLAGLRLPLPNSRAAGAMAANTDDYDRFLEMSQGRGTFRGVKVLSAESVEQLFVSRSLDLEVISTPNPLPLGYGLGLWIDAADGDGTTTRVSSPGAWGAVGWVSLSNCHRGYLHTLAGGVNGTEPYLGLQPLLDEIISCDTTPPADPQTTPRVAAMKPEVPSATDNESESESESGNIGRIASEGNSSRGRRPGIAIIAVIIVATAAIVMRRRALRS